jgi:hypothetical protein
MAHLISDKEFLSKNLYQVMAKGMQYEALDAKKTGVKALSNLQSNLTKEPPFEEVKKYVITINAMLFYFTKLF